MEFDNVGIFDTAVRAIIAVVLLSLAVQSFFPPLLTAVLVIAGLVFAVTSAVGWCPLYRLFKIDTFHKKQAH